MCGMMWNMQRDWSRLGAALKAAREARGLGQADVGEEIGVKRGAMRNIENGQLSRITPTVRAYAHVVGWSDGSVEAVLAGGEPVSAARPSGGPEVNAAGVIAAEELPLRIRAALADGPLIDSAVISLPGEGGEADAQMVVVVKGRPNASPDQLRKALLAWEQTEQQLRRHEDSA